VTHLLSGVGNGIAPLSGGQAAQAFIKLEHLLKKIWSGPDASTRPLLMGPDGGNWLPDFLDGLENASVVLDAFTYHTCRLRSSQ
jgi:hypothetical protein